jgi:hypothetical protein
MCVHYCTDVFGLTPAGIPGGRVGRQHFFGGRYYDVVQSAGRLLVGHAERHTVRHGLERMSRSEQIRRQEVVQSIPLYCDTGDDVKHRVEQVLTEEHGPHHGFLGEL